MWHSIRALVIGATLVGWGLFAAPAQAVTLKQARMAMALIKTVDGLAPEERTRFIAQNREQLNIALHIRQSVADLLHMADAVSQVSERMYQRKLICNADDDDDETDAAPTSAAKAPDLPDLDKMAVDFKADLRGVLHLPDTPETDAKLDDVDVADLLANRYLADHRCPLNSVPARTHHATTKK